MKRLYRSSILILLLAIAFATGVCARFSKEGRQERAYAKYVRKSSYTQAKRSIKLRPGKVQLPPMELSEPVTTTETSPVAMTSSDGPSE